MRPIFEKAIGSEKSSALVLVAQNQTSPPSAPCSADAVSLRDLRTARDEAAPARWQKRQTQAYLP